MIHYKYSSSQLEEKANDLLRKFDPERLVRPKPLDVYAVVEKCLDVPYDWKYITPDQSIMGMTFFKAGYQWVWPAPYYEDGMKPEKLYCEKGTILIDTILTEYEDRGPENFTVMHEVFHQVLHKRCFAHCNPDYTHQTTSGALMLSSDKTYRTSLEINESQANYCAACFLMPRELVTKCFTSFGLINGISSDSPIFMNMLKNMAEEFNVSKKAMLIRLKSLKLLN